MFSLGASRKVFTQGSSYSFLIFFFIIVLENYILQSNGTHKILQKYKHRKCTKQERHRYMWFTQFGLRPPQTASPSFLLSSKIKRHNLQEIRCNILCFLSQSHLSISHSQNTHLYLSLQYNTLIPKGGVAF